MSSEPVIAADSGLAITHEFIQTLREVGLESLANYYLAVYNCHESWYSTS